jgi:hypothetical protein
MEQASRVHGSCTTVQIGPQTSSLPPAPKILWTYWQEEPLPAIVQACVRSWTTHHPELQVRVVTRAGLTNVLPELGALHVSFPWIDSAARESDLVRLHLLARYGGVWLDASILLAQPLTFHLGVMTRQGPEFSGFYLQGFTTNPDSPVLESWALASRPGAPFVTAWLRELLSIPAHTDGVAAKLEQYVAAGVDMQGIHGPHYLLIHVAAQFLLQRRRHVVSMELLCAEDGPYSYLQRVGWDSARGVRAMVAGFPGSGGVFKMRGSERGYLTDLESGRLLELAGSPAPA